MGADSDRCQLTSCFSLVLGLDSRHPVSPFTDTSKLRLVKVVLVVQSIIVITLVIYVSYSDAMCVSDEIVQRLNEYSMATSMPLIMPEVTVKATYLLMRVHAIHYAGSDSESYSFVDESLGMQPNSYSQRTTSMLLILLEVTVKATH